MIRGLVGKIISRFEDKELFIVRIEIKHKNAAWCSKHYNHLPDDILEQVCEFMTEHPIIGICFAGERAHQIAKRLVGRTDSTEAEPGTIRGDYGSTPIMRNIIHVSDSFENSKRESDLFFNHRTDK